MRPHVSSRPAPAPHLLVPPGPSRPAPRLLGCLDGGVAGVPRWVSGSSETKTYGKGVALREHEEQHTLPRRSIFGKDLDARSRVCNMLHVLLSPPEALFSG